MFLSFLITLSSAFALVSPFPSTVENLNIPNSHAIEENQSLIRGMRPRTEQDIDELIKLGVTDVLVFKNSTANDTSTEDEIVMLEKKGMKRNRIHVIPFKWKEAESFETACLQTIQALKLMREVVQDKNRKLFLHCTVGEDRTGYLAGLYRILFQNIKTSQAYRHEMCANGYAEGNPQKPIKVVQDVHKTVSILFQQMAHKIRWGYISADNLDEAECSFDPFRSERFEIRNKFLRCEPSSKYDPTIE